MPAAPTTDEGEGTIDLGLYLQVIREHRRLVIVGVLLTILLAFLSYVRVSPSGIGYRKPEVWSNESTLVLSQAGFPEGRSVLPGQAQQASPYATPDRFSSLVDLYAALATGDAVTTALEARGLIDAADLEDGKLPIAAEPVPTSTGATTPLVKLSASGASPAEATKLTVGATKAFVDVVRTQQLEAKIPPSQRIELRVVKRAGEPTLIVPRSKTMSIVLILAGLTATIATAFVRHNARRTRHLTPLEEPEAGHPKAVQPVTEAEPWVGEPEPRLRQVGRWAKRQSG